MRLEVQMGDPQKANNVKNAGNEVFTQPSSELPSSLSS